MHPGKFNWGIKIPPAVLGGGQRAFQEHVWWCRAHGWSVADRPETQLSNFPWFGLFVLVWCFVHVGVVTMFLFFSSFFREDLPCWFNDWVHFLFRHRWRFFDSKKKGASAWQNSPINRKAKYCSQAGNPAYWTNLNWTDVLTSTFLNVEGFWPPLKLAIMLRTHEILQQFCLTEI